VRADPSRALDHRCRIARARIAITRYLASRLRVLACPPGRSSGLVFVATRGGAGGGRGHTPGGGVAEAGNGPGRPGAPSLPEAISRARHPRWKRPAQAVCRPVERTDASEPDMTGGPLVSSPTGGRHECLHLKSAVTRGTDMLFQPDWVMVFMVEPLAPVDSSGQCAPRTKSSIPPPKTGEVGEQ
jgi:hypothetical protein